MRITILSVGNIKEKYLKDAIEEYSKRISKFCKIDFIQVNDEAIVENPSDKQMELVKEKEGEKIIKALPKSCYKIVLDLKGVMLSSDELANKLLDVFTYNGSHICFIIGGSLGLSNEVLQKADYHLCFSKMTFPHQLMKVILLEQIYRAFKIINNEPYHK